MRLLRDQRKFLWDEIVELISLKQLEQVMFLTWHEKATAIKIVSKSKKVHALADKILSENARISREFTWFKGVPFERTTLVKELIYAYVVAVQEYDHESAEEIEEFLFDLKYAPTREEIYKGA